MTCLCRGKWNPNVLSSRRVGILTEYIARYVRLPTILTISAVAIFLSALRRRMVWQNVRLHRNRHLGEFLKELGLTEGRNTGIPTIQRELEKNGSPAATFDTDEDRLSFLVRIPCHEGEEGFSETLLAETTSGKGNGGVNESGDQDVPVNVPVNVPANVPVNLSETQKQVLALIKVLPQITHSELASRLSVSDKTTKRATKALRELGIIAREGSDKAGKWIILK